MVEFSSKSMFAYKNNNFTTSFSNKSFLKIWRNLTKYMFSSTAKVSSEMFKHKRNENNNILKDFYFNKKYVNLINEDDLNNKLIKNLEYYKSGTNSTFQVEKSPEFYKELVDSSVPVFTNKFYIKQHNDLLYVYLKFIDYFSYVIVFFYFLFFCFFYLYIFSKFEFFSFFSFSLYPFDFFSEFFNDNIKK